MQETRWSCKQQLSLLEFPAVKRRFCGQNNIKKNSILDLVTSQIPSDCLIKTLTVCNLQVLGLT